MSENLPPQPTTRRGFLKTSALAAAGVSLASRLPLSSPVHAAGNGVIKAGLIGCGGRGTAAAFNALAAGKDVRITALADVFPDKVENAAGKLKKQKPDQVDLPKDRQFVGFDAYQKLIQSGVDVVLIAPSSHFIPEMLQAAIAAGKHVFCEKPHGLDVPGVKICMAAAEEAKKKKLSLVSGLCWRYDLGVRETMKRVRDGAIGDILVVHENYLAAPYYPIARTPGWTEMEYQFRNWYHFNWLSGDQTAQQLVHSIDKGSWALGDQPPVKAYGMGGRHTCLDPQFGDQFDHQAVVFEYANGVRMFGFTRDQADCHRDVNDYIFGTKGRCHLLNHTLEGATTWRYDGPKPNMYDVEHAELFESIRQSRPINNGDYMCTSTLLAIMAQVACYSGQVVLWSDLLKSKRSFALPKYGWDVEPPVKPGPDGRYPTAVQGPAEYALWQMEG